MKAAAGEERIRVEYEDLDELLKRRHPGNPKEHDLPLIGESFEEFGFTIPVLLDEGSDLVGAGHGRIDRLAEERAAGRQAPKRILVRGDRWLVPVLRGVSFQDEEQLLKYLVMDNRAPERGGWNNRRLVEVLSRVGKTNLRGTGFGSDDLVTFLARLRTEPRTGQGNPEEVPDLPKRAVTKPGQLWQLGDHRILCGETTDPAVVRRVAAGAVVAVIHADPPYGMGKEAEGIENDNLYAEKLDAFQVRWWAAWLTVLSSAGSAYVWGNAPDLWRLWWRHLSADEDLMFRNEVVWDKEHGQGERTASAHSFPPATERCLFVMRGEQFLGNQNKDDYWEGYEPLRAWLEAEREKAGWTNGRVNKITGTKMAGHWFGKSQFMPISRANYEKLAAAAEGTAFVEPYVDLFGRLFPDVRRGGGDHRRDLSAKLRGARTYFDNTHDAMTDVWRFPRVRGEERFGHASPKPVAMAARAIKSSAPVGGVCAVPFLGTGPEVVAAEQWERRVVGVELKPEYCDVVIERWQTFSGKKARRLAA